MDRYSYHVLIIIPVSHLTPSLKHHHPYIALPLPSFQLAVEVVESAARVVLVLLVLLDLPVAMEPLVTMDPLEDPVLPEPMLLPTLELPRRLVNIYITFYNSIQTSNCSASIALLDLLAPQETLEHLAPPDLPVTPVHLDKAVVSISSQLDRSNVGYRIVVFQEQDSPVLLVLPVPLEILALLVLLDSLAVPDK